jgi:hypothetical protein
LYEPWRLVLRGEHDLTDFEAVFLRVISECYMKVRTGVKKLHFKELHAFTQYEILLDESSRMMFAGHVAYTE